MSIQICIMKLKRKRGDTMISAAKTTGHMEAKNSEKLAMKSLYDELAKGIHNIEQGEVYTIEEAWKEIDKI